MTDEGAHVQLVVRTGPTSSSHTPRGLTLLSRLTRHGPTQWTRMSTRLTCMSHVHEDSSPLHEAVDLATRDSQHLGGSPPRTPNRWGRRCEAPRRRRATSWHARSTPPARRGGDSEELQVLGLEGFHHPSNLLRILGAEMHLAYAAGAHQRGHVRPVDPAAGHDTDSSRREAHQ